MYSRSLLPRIIQHEISMGNSHECLECGKQFFAHSDGCPECGNWAKTRLLRNSEDIDEISNRETRG